MTEAKREGDSFSDVIERALEKRGSLLSLWGVADSKETAQVGEETRKIRKRATIRT